jgi:hypothetical protein
VFEGAVVAPLSGQQPLDTQLARPCLIGPRTPLVDNKPLAVVLVHGGIHTLLGVRRGGDQINAETGIVEGGRHG